MNKFMLDKIKDRLKTLPDDMREELLREASLMSKLGVETEEGYRDAFLISIHAKNIAEELTGRSLNALEISKVSAHIMENISEFPIDTIFNFYLATARALNAIDVPIKKTAYPHDSAGLFYPQPFNRIKWTRAMQDIYRRTPHVGRTQAFDQVTENWDNMEKDKFKNWMSFYEEGTHKKYKIAQLGIFEVGQGAYLPIDTNDLRASIPMGSYDPASVGPPESTPPGPSQAELVRKEVIALIGRLNSAERIATKTDAIRNVLGPEGFKTWLNALHTIKREIQSAPIVNAKSSTPIDLIIKQANILAHNGYDGPARLMMKLAQVSPPPLAPGGGGAPPPAEVAGPGLEDPGAGMGAEPAMDPNMEPQPGGDVDEDSPEAYAAIEEFLDNISGESGNDESDVNDSDSELVVSEDDLVATAQALPGEPGEPGEPEVSNAPEKDKGDKARELMHGGGDEIEAALQNVTIERVIERLESLSHIYGNRELARQINIIDLMLGRLGLASYFPSLAEAMKSALDSNQYVLTRLEDIISKLRGSVEGEHQIDLAGGGEAPGAEGIKGKLQEDAEKEKARKERRKAMQEAEAAGAPAAAPAAPGAPTAPEAPGAELAGAGPATVERPPRV